MRRTPRAYTGWLYGCQTRDRMSSLIWQQASLTSWRARGLPCQERTRTPAPPHPSTPHGKVRDLGRRSWRPERISLGSSKLDDLLISYCLSTSCLLLSPIGIFQIQKKDLSFIFQPRCFDLQQFHFCGFPSNHDERSQ